MNSTRNLSTKSICVVCGCKTIESKNSGETCEVCDWVDGDNGDYTVDEAKENFESSGTIFRPEDSRCPENSDYLLLNWKLRKAFKEHETEASEASLATIEDLRMKKMTTPRMGGTPLWAPTGEPVFECPCCHYPTLSARGSFEICDVCHWEDEFVDYPPSEEVIGGANGDYSMKEARENLARYGIMYRPGDYRFIASQEEQKIQWNLQKVYAEIKRTGPTEELYEKISALRVALRPLWRKKMDELRKSRE